MGGPECGGLKALVISGDADLNIDWQGGHDLGQLLCAAGGFLGPAGIGHVCRLHCTGPGHLADLPEEFFEVKVLMTVVGGKPDHLAVGFRAWVTANGDAGGVGPPRGHTGW